MDQQVVIDIKPKEQKIKKYLIPGIILAAIILIPLGIGFVFGKYTNLYKYFEKEEEITKSATREGWYIFETDKYSFEYPKDWEVSENPEDMATGASITGEGGKVEFWLDDDRSYKFSEKQKKEQLTTKTSKITIDGQEVKLLEFPYKSGDYFLITEVPETNKKPQVTIWANAANPGFRQNVLEIITTIQTKSESKK